MSSYESKPVTIASADVFFAAGIRIVGSGTEKGVLIPYSRSFFTKIPQYPASRYFFFFVQKKPPDFAIGSASWDVFDKVL